MDGDSLDIVQTNLEKLKQFLPELFAEDQLDWEKLRATFSNDINFSNERYVLNWAGKSDAFKILQVPTTATLQPQPEESIHFDTAENLFIEGENLEVLKVLQRSYHGKIKVICIDPPYNTGSDSFVYPDKFSEKKEDYLKRIGEKDEEGNLMKDGLFRKNSKDSGHFHSNWLSMMYPRLFLAKNLLRDDGVILIHIDDNEIHNLRLLMNEIFGEENFISQVVIETATDNNPSLIANEHEYLLVYCKNKSLHSVWKKDSEKADRIKQKYAELKPVWDDPQSIQIELRKWINQNKESLSGFLHYNNVDEKGVFHDADIANPKFGGYFYEVVHPVTGKACKIPEKGFRYPEDTLKKLINDGDVVFGEDETVLIKPKKRLEDSKESFRSVIYNDGRAASKRLSDLMGRDIFKFPKDELLEKSFLEFVADKNDIILDFFAGSGTTAHAVLEQNKTDNGNRKFILVQLPELCEEKSEAFKAGYKTIADISKERIRRVIKKIRNENNKPEKLIVKSSKELTDLLIANIEKESEGPGFKVFKLIPSNFRIWRGSEINAENLLQQLDIFTNPVNETGSAQGMLYELMLKSGYSLTDKVVFADNLYFVNDGEIVIALHNINESMIRQVIVTNPKKLIALDKLFAGNDQLKTNTMLQLKDAGIDFKTI